MEKQLDNVMKSLQIPGKAKLAVACSGGPDSMALALAAAGWAKTHGFEIVALTVNHGLRKGSGKEAKQVGAWLKKHGITHAILTWQGKKPTSNIQEEARKARYKLIADYCHSHKIKYLLVAHHKEDQAETFLLRLARGSGVDGLAAMASVTHIHDITLVRPFLDVSKHELLAYLKKHKQPYVNDPSNENTAFDRVKMRALLPELARVGLSADRLAKTAANMARARTHLEEETGKFLNKHCKIFPEGYALLRQLHSSEEIALRALSTLIMCIGGQETKTRLNDLERLYRDIKNPAFRGATLGGCIFARHKKDILICREVKAVAGTLPIKAGEAKMWDNRFEVSLTVTPPLSFPRHSAGGEAAAQNLMRSRALVFRFAKNEPRDDGTYVVGALGQEGWLFVAKHHKLKSPVPDKRILYTLPALRDKDGWIHSVPHLGLSVEDVKCSVVFNTPV